MPNIIQFGSLTVTVQETDREVTYTFSGEVNESFKQKDLPRPSRKIVNLILEGITHFNSCGIREWVYLIKDFAKQGDIIFKRCSVAMIDQINMVPDSILCGRIESFYAPYACEDHGEINKLIDISTMQSVSKEPPAMTCDHCQKSLEFDALPQSYFLFMDESVPKAS